MKLISDIQKIEDKKLFLCIWTLLVLVWILSSLSPIIFKTERYIFDYSDLIAYYDRANWVLTHNVPVSEYPQIPTYFLGLNKFISGFFDSSIRFVIFYSITGFEMIVALFFIIKILFESFPSDRKYRSLLLLLPPTLYFVVNRFDILPALLCVIALKMANEKKWVFSSIILSLATFTKWYPILIFPGFFMFASIQENKLQWKMIFFFLITSLLVIAPTYLLGGMEAVLFPYQFHMARGMEFVALPVLINDFLRNVANIMVSQNYYFLFFFILQIYSPLLILFLKINTLERLVKYCIIAISIFILFSRISSPQWFIWLLPFLIISINNKIDIWIIVLYNIVTYLSFPIVFDLFGPSSIQMKIFGILTYIIITTIIIRSFAEMRENANPLLARK